MLIQCFAEGIHLELHNWGFNQGSPFAHCILTMVLSVMGYYRGVSTGSIKGLNKGIGQLHRGQASCGSSRSGVCNLKRTLGSWLLGAGRILVKVI